MGYRAPGSFLAWTQSRFGGGVVGGGVVGCGLPGAGAAGCGGCWMEEASALRIPFTFGPGGGSRLWGRARFITV